MDYNPLFSPARPFSRNDINFNTRAIWTKVNFNNFLSKCSKFFQVYSWIIQNNLFLQVYSRCSFSSSGCPLNAKSSNGRIWHKRRNPHSSYGSILMWWCFGNQFVQCFPWYCFFTRYLFFPFVSNRFLYSN